MADKQNREEAQQTFRQFVWHLAGSLTSTKNGVRRPPRPSTKR
jgi:hypothetical protein